MTEQASYFQTRLLATRDALNSIQNLQQRQHVLQGIMTELGAVIGAHQCKNGCSDLKENGNSTAKEFRKEIMDALDLEFQFDDEEVENHTSQVLIIDDNQYIPLYPGRPKESIDMALALIDRPTNQKLENIFSKMIQWAIAHAIIDPNKAPDKEVYASTVASIRPKDSDDDDDDDDKEKKKK